MEVMRACGEAAQQQPIGPAAMHRDALMQQKPSDMVLGYPQGFEILMAWPVTKAQGHTLTVPKREA